MDLGSAILVIFLCGMFVVLILVVTELLLKRYDTDGRRRRSANEIWKESDR